MANNRPILRKVRGLGLHFGGNISNPRQGMNEVNGFSRTTRVRPRQHNFVTWLSIACLVPWITGCQSLQDYTLTGKLWTGDVGVNHCTPAPEPNLKMSQTPDGKDVVVQYDEIFGDGSKTRKRAYLLLANRNLAAGHKPRFLRNSKAAKLARTPLETDYLTNSAAAGDTALRAVLMEDLRHFSLVSNGREVGQYALPDYVTASGAWTKSVLTPFTVVGDVVIYAGVAALLAGYGYLASGAPGLNH
jgi:hypothetical protein